MANEQAKSRTPKVDQLRQALQAEKDKILAELAPAREVYERKINDPELIEARKTIAAKNALMAEIDNELSAIAAAKGSGGVEAQAGQFAG